MTKRCLDEGLLQAYMDGELSRERAAEAASHLGACDACAAALADLESENTFLAAAFAPDESIGVPTEILRSRIGAAIAQLEDVQGTNRGRSSGRFNSFLASLSGLFNFTPQRAAGFASVLVVITAGIIYFAVVKQRPAPNAPQPSREIASSGTGDMNPKATTPTPNVVKPTPAPTREKGSVKVSFQKPRGDRIRMLPLEARNVNSLLTLQPGETREGNIVSGSKSEKLLPGEKDYMAAIASLDKTIKMGGDASLKPSLRIDYERNLAILDGAIEQTRKVAAQNPKDKDAVGFLMSAYQSKVELLTKVADQAQVSALGR